jgi:pimeloyl-ACP methyl ester carboxylesterase
MMPLARLLNGDGYRTIVPFLGGFGPTHFQHRNTFRDGRAVALTQDAIDLLDVLGIERCTVVGHYWGARAAYNLAAIAPHRLQAVIGPGLQYSPNGKFEISDFEQARLGGISGL